MTQNLPFFLIMILSCVQKLTENLIIWMAWKTFMTMEQKQLRIWSHLLKKYLMENFFFWPV